MLVLPAPFDETNNEVEDIRKDQELETKKYDQE
jgi:hypothetical protein